MLNEDNLKKIKNNKVKGFLSTSKILKELNYNNTFEVFEEAYLRKDIKLGKIVADLFPNFMYEGTFRKLVKEELKENNPSNIKYLSKDFISYLKETNVLNNNEELNNILIYNKIIKINKSNLIFDKLSYKFNLDFILSCNEIHNYPFPASVINNLIYEDKQINNKYCDKILDLLLKEANSSSKFFKKFYVTKDNIAYSILMINLLENIPLSLIKTSKQLELKEYLNIMFKNIDSPEENFLKNMNPEKKLEIYKKLEYLGVDIKYRKEILQNLKLYNYEDLSKNLNYLEKYISLGFDLNAKNDFFWGENLLKEGYHEEMLKIYDYALEKGLDILSYRKEYDNLNIYDYVLKNMFLTTKMKENWLLIKEKNILYNINKEKKVLNKTLSSSFNNKSLKRL